MSRSTVCWNLRIFLSGFLLSISVSKFILVSKPISVKLSWFQLLSLLPKTVPCNEFCVFSSTYFVFMFLFLFFFKNDAQFTVKKSTFKYYFCSRLSEVIFFILNIFFLSLYSLLITFKLVEFSLLHLRQSVRTGHNRFFSIFHYLLQSLFSLESGSCLRSSSTGRIFATLLEAIWQFSDISKAILRILLQLFLTFSWVNFLFHIFLFLLRLQDDVLILM